MSTQDHQNKIWTEFLLKNTQFYKQIDEFFIALNYITTPSKNYPSDKLKQIRNTLYLKFAAEHKLVWNGKEDIKPSADEIKRIYKAILTPPVYSTHQDKEGKTVSADNDIPLKDRLNIPKLDAIQTCISYHQLLVKEERRVIIPLSFFVEYPRGANLNNYVANQFREKRKFAERAIRETGFSLLDDKVSIDKVKELTRQYANELKMTDTEVGNSVLFVACEQACLRYDSNVIHKSCYNHQFSMQEKLNLANSTNYLDYLARCSRFNQRAMIPVLPYITKQHYHHTHF